MKNLKIKKVVLGLLATVLIKESILDQDIIEPYSSYKNGNVYINNNYEILEYINNNDVFILDQREIDDPNYKIVNSYLIQDKETIEEIIDILLKYEKENPSNWNRSRDSLIKEWQIHNYLFYRGISIQRTKDVDLNNNDETKFSIFTFTRKFNKK